MKHFKEKSENVKKGEGTKNVKLSCYYHHGTNMQTRDIREE
jgi:hypothetical protein